MNVSRRKWVQRGAGYAIIPNQEVTYSDKRMPDELFSAKSKTWEKTIVYHLQVRKHRLF